MWWVPLAWLEPVASTTSTAVMQVLTSMAPSFRDRPLPMLCRAPFIDASNHAGTATPWGIVTVPAEPLYWNVIRRSRVARSTHGRRRADRRVPQRAQLHNSGGDAATRRRQPAL